ncbi:hypothetical protein [Halovivax limisalsi]|uniref:hypothetical protein n=1 Tax=Halovivax limisalsi TaxID=1453760 RepID=UPI001FFDBAF0|nr:hypothetical protein [Halovivax limisalsi]
MNRERIVERLSSRVFLTVAGSTVLLTFAFVGLAVLWEGRIVANVTSRLPFYVLVFAIAFIFALLKLDNRERDGTQILVATAGIGLVAAIIFGLAIEGAAYTLYEPYEVFQTGLVVVFLAAGIICTGLGIWGVRHWREFVATGGPASTDAEMERLEGG